MKFYIITAAAIIIADFVVKLLVRLNMQLGATIPLIDGVFHITYLRNTGAAFGIFPGARWILIALSILIIAGFIYVILARKFEDKWTRFGIAFMLGGAVGNLIDRLFLGYVVDYLDFRLINFPVFNIADIFVTVGAGMVIVYTILTSIQEARVKKDES